MTAVAQMWRWKALSGANPARELRWAAFCRRRAGGSREEEGASSQDEHEDCADGWGLEEPGMLYRLGLAAMPWELSGASFEARPSRAAFRRRS